MTKFIKSMAYRNIEQSMDSDLNQPENWIKSFAPVRHWDSSKNIDRKDFKLLQKNFPDNQTTHSGLIYYLHLCWAKELGCVLRPDMIYYTILSEIARTVVDHPSTFRSLFTTQQNKQTIVTIDMDAINGGLNVETLCQNMKNKVANPELHQLICDIHFENDDDLAHEARCMVFANMGVPYFDYMSTMCGISSVEIQGGIDDWKKLFDIIGRLRRIFNMPDNFENEWQIRQMSQLLRKSFETISTIIHFMFDNKFANYSEYQDIQSFKANIFHYGHNKHCGSGHDDYLVSGWARNFYASNGDDLDKFSPSMVYVPYQNIETGRMFIQVCTLAYSDINNGIANPHYGKLMFEISNRETFGKISMK